MLIFTLNLHPLRIRHILILVARIIPRRPLDKLVPIPALPRLVAFVAFAQGLGGQFEPGRVVCVAVDVLQEAVEAVLYVVVEVVVCWGAAVGGGCVFLDLDL